MMFVDDFLDHAMNLKTCAIPHGLLVALPYFKTNFKKKT
jgi:hypothetical protein